MSRSLGLRDDQRVREALVMQIAGLFAAQPCWPIHEQSRSHTEHARHVGRGLFARRPIQPRQI